MSDRDVYDDTGIDPLLTGEEQRRLSDNAIDDYAADGANSAEDYANSAHERGGSEGDAAPGTPAANLLAKERDVAKGGFGTTSGLFKPRGSSLAGGALPGTGPQLEALEKNATPVSEITSPTNFTGGGGALPKTINGKFGKLALWYRRWRTVILMLSALGAAGTGLGFVGGLASGFQLIHFGEFLSDVHMEPKHGQSESRTIRFLRNAKFVLNGQPERTRLGMIGNYIADKATTQFREAGIESKYNPTSGRFEGYTLDPTKLKGAEFDQLTDKSEAGVQKFLEEKLKLPAGSITPNGDGTIGIKGKGLGWLEERRLLKGVMDLSGYTKGIPSMITRGSVGKKNLIGWKHFADKKKADAVEKRAAKIEKWKNRIREIIKPGSTKVATPNIETTPGEDGKPVSEQEQIKSDVEETTADAEKAGQAAAQGDTQAVDKFALKLKAKMALSGVGLLGIFCFFQYQAAHFDETYQRVIEKPMVRMAAYSMSLSGQLEDGKTDFDSDVIGFENDLLTDTRPGPNQGSVMDAQSIQAQQGLPLSGKPIPASARPDRKGNPIVQILDFGPGVEAVCNALDNYAVQGLIIVGSVFAFGRVATAIGTAVSFAGAKAIDFAIEEIAKFVAGTAVDELAPGPDKGSFTDYGAAFMAKDDGLFNAGTAISPAEHQAQQNASFAIINGEFRQKSLAYRLFNPEDRQSFVAQVMDKQDPNPVSNIAQAGLNLLNIKKTISTLAIMPFSKPVSAAAPFDYGFDDMSWTQAELNSDETDAVVVRKTAPTILDKNQKDHPAKDPDNYITRARICFGVNIVQTMGKDPATDKDVLQYGTGQITPDLIPLQKDIEDPKNKCYLQDGNMTDSEVKDWLTVRALIALSNTANAVACYLSDGQTTTFEGKVLKQGCIDVGQENGPPTATVAPAGDTSGGAVPAGIGLKNWYLTLPVGSSGKPDEISCEDIGNGVTKDPWYVKSGSGYTFKVDTSAGNKATTPNSKNYRSEYREMKDDCKGKADWSSSESSEMTVTTNVKSNSAKAVVVGQIHDDKDDIAVFRVEGSDLHITNGDDTKWKVLPGAITQGKAFTIKFVVQSNNIDFYLDGKKVASQPHTFSGAYYKAGNYLQGDGKAEVEITALQVKHNGKVTSGGDGADLGSGAGKAATTPGAAPTGGAVTSDDPNNRQTLDGLGAGAGATP